MFAVIAILFIVVVVLGYLAVKGVFTPKAGQVAQAQPTQTAPAQVKADVTVAATESATEPVAAPNTELPAATQPQAIAEATSAPTPVPPPTPVGTVQVANTALPSGGGESDALPNTASGVWFIPVGVVVLIVAAWWRWRRVHAAG